MTAFKQNKTPESVPKISLKRIDGRMVMLYNIMQKLP